MIIGSAYLEVPQAEEKQVQAKVEPFKLSSECYDQINAYLNSVPPMDGFQFLFPDRNDPASIEELLYNPPPEVLEIQLGKYSHVEFAKRHEAMSKKLVHMGTMKNR